MLGKLHDFVIRCSLSWWKTSLVIAGFGLTFSQLQVVTGRFGAISGGHTPFDMQNSLTVEQVFVQLSTWTDAAFNDYIWFQFVDFFFPVFGGLMLATLSAFAVRNLSGRYYEIANRRNLFLLFFVPTLFDWLENAGFLLVVNAWPEAAESAALLGVTAKKFKLATLFVANPLAFLLLIAALLKLAWLRVRG